MSLGTLLFVSNVDPGNENLMCKRIGAKIFSLGLRYGKVLLRSSARCVEFVVTGEIFLTL